MSQILKCSAGKASIYFALDELRGSVCKELKKSLFGSAVGADAAELRVSD
jgi:hypothetical protein